MGVLGCPYCFLNNYGILHLRFLVDLLLVVRNVGIKDDSHPQGLFLTLTMKCAGSSDLDHVHQAAALYPLPLAHSFGGFGLKD